MQLNLPFSRGCHADRGAGFGQRCWPSPSRVCPQTFALQARKQKKERMMFQHQLVLESIQTFLQRCKCCLTLLAKCTSLPLSWTIAYYHAPHMTSLVETEWLHVWRSPCISLYGACLRKPLLCTRDTVILTHSNLIQIQFRCLIWGFLERCFSW